MNLLFHRLLLLSALIAGSNSLSNAKAGLVPREGFVQVEGGPIWYRIFGSGKGIPILIVHGGPGSRSCYYENLAVILGKDRPVIVYDQLGTGRSGRPIDTSLWKVERFVRELGQFRAALKLDRINLMGHSWGAAVVAAYLSMGKPKGVESVIFAGPYLSSKLWVEDANILLSQLPKDTQATLKRHEQAGTTESKEYQEAAEVFYSRFMYHKPRPSLPASCGESKGNDEIYTLMWGASEFSVTGTLKTFDITPVLPRLKMPVLFVVGQFDEVRPETATLLQAMVPKAKLEILEGCGHMAPIEDPEAYANALNLFLGKIGSSPKN
ncbi:MAG: proline iminopeptidase-family hydrolase [Geothrix sp.]|uniref:proline iminopeptidase-family hydrolase n=1 Tax=Geothrix sp. TaxID=1962974 RepID=UPI003BB0E177